MNLKIYSTKPELNVFIYNSTFFYQISKNVCGHCNGALNERVCNSGKSEYKRHWPIQLWLKYNTSVHFTKTDDHVNTFVDSPFRALNWTNVSEKSFSFSFIVSILINLTVFSDISTLFSVMSPSYTLVLIFPIYLLGYGKGRWTTV